MKIKELKHNHSLTELLKVILFSIVMLLPFFSVLTKSLYVVCNKNAKDSYYGETINEYEYIKTSFNDLSIGDNYTLINYNFVAENTNSFVFFNVSNFVDNTTGTTYDDVSSIRIFYNSYYILRCISSNQNFDYNLSAGNQNLSFNFMGITSTSADISQFDFLFKIQYNKYSYLDNAFEYSLYQLQNSNFYNWTTNTATYTGINAMCNGIGVNMDVIPMILTYWFLISVIYIVLDIVIKVITYLTHMIGSRTAE